MECSERCVDRALHSTPRVSGLDAGSAVPIDVATERMGDRTSIISGTRDISRRATLRLSTDDVPEHSRFDYWEDICRRLIGGFEFVDCERKELRAAFNMLSIDNLTIAHYVGSPHAMDRRRSHIRSTDNDSYLIILESPKTFNLDHGGYRKSSAGGISLIDNATPFLGAHPEGLDILNVFVPRAVLEQALGPARYVTGLSIDPMQASFPIITTYLQTLIEHGPLLDPARQARMAAVAVELIAAGFAERIEVDPLPSLSSAAILCRAQTYIANHIGHEGLSMNDVAMALRISVRRLQEVANAQNVSLMDWMWERRLRLAQERLADPANQVVPIGLIAYQCGFASQAHFSRRFKERFGQTPTEFKVWAGLQRGQL